MMSGAMPLCWQPNIWPVRPKPVCTSSTINVGLVHHDVKAGVEEPLCLFPDHFHHFGIRMTDIQNTDAPSEVYVSVPVHILDERADAS
jgi:hypothetical protein